MQPLTPGLEAILNSKMQAGASGYRCLVEIKSRAVGLLAQTADPASGRVDVVLGSTPPANATQRIQFVMRQVAVSSNWRFYVYMGPADALVGFLSSGGETLRAGDGGTADISALDWSSDVNVAFDYDDDTNVVQGKAWQVGDAEPGWLSEGEWQDDPLVLGSFGLLAQNAETDAATHWISEVRIWTSGVEVGAPFDKFMRAARVGGWGQSDHGETWDATYTDPDMVQILFDYAEWSKLPRPIRLSIDHSLQTDGDQMEAVFDNSDGSLDLWAPDNLVPPNTLIRASEWYGDTDPPRENAVQRFEGFVDKVVQSRRPRDPHVVTITARDWMKPLLVTDVATTAPQRADEDGAVRTTANYVYLNMEVSAIIVDLLTKAGIHPDRQVVSATSYAPAEFIGQDGVKIADVAFEAADLVGYNLYADELGRIVFEPDLKEQAGLETGDGATPVWTFETGVNVTRLDPSRDDLELKTRVKVTGPFTQMQDAWTEVWHTNVIRHPSGTKFDADDPGFIHVVDGLTRKLYRIRQSDRVITADSVDPLGNGGFLNGLSADPSDDTIYWLLETPYVTGGSLSDNVLHKMLRADNTIIASYPLPSLRYTSVKVSTSWIWLAETDNDQIERWTKGDPPVFATAIDVVYLGVPQLTPTGVMVDDTTNRIYLGFQPHARLLELNLSDFVSEVQTFIRALPLPGTLSLGGDIDTVTHTEIYVGAYELGLVYKMTLFTAVDSTVSVEVADAALEATLGRDLTGAQRRRLVVHVDKILSVAQATETANRWLLKLSHYRDVLEVGVIANPGIQKADMVRIVDPVTQIDSDWAVDRYHTEMAPGPDGTYLGELSLIPWSPEY